MLTTNGKEQFSIFIVVAFHADWNQLIFFSVDWLICYSKKKKQTFFDDVISKYESFETVMTRFEFK